MLKILGVTGTGNGVEAVRVAVTEGDWGYNNHNEWTCTYRAEDTQIMWRLMLSDRLSIFELSNHLFDNQLEALKAKKSLDLLFEKTCKTKRAIKLYSANAAKIRTVLLELDNDEVWKVTLFPPTHHLYVKKMQSKVLKHEANKLVGNCVVYTGQRYVTINSKQSHNKKLLEISDALNCR